MFQAVLQGHAPGGAGQEVQLRIPGKGSRPQTIPAKERHRLHQGGLGQIHALTT